MVVETIFAVPAKSAGASYICPNYFQNSSLLKKINNYLINMYVAAYVYPDFAVFA